MKQIREKTRHITDVAATPRLAWRPWLYGWDVVAWVVAVWTAQALRFDLDVGQIEAGSMVVLAALVVVVQFGVGRALELYRNRFTPGSFEEVRALAMAVLTGGLVFGAVVGIWGPRLGVPRSSTLIAAPIALVLMFSVRYLHRQTADHRRRPGRDAVPVIVFGAGAVGTNLIHHMVTDPASAYRPVAMLDDDPRQRNAQCRNVKVCGTLQDLPEVADRTGAQAVVVAIGRSDAALVRRVDEAADRAGIGVKVMPTVSEVLSAPKAGPDLRDLSIEDLLGRQVVDLQVESVAGYLAGQRVLVTGAGGSIGSELCAQIARLGPAELIMLDRDETALQQVQLRVDGNGLLDTPDVVLADIRDPDRLREVFAQRRPQVVFHAAALKHLPMLERYPEEAWKTNVLGTLNVLEAARSVGVGTFVNISTDKAANACCVLGHSKRLAERLASGMAEAGGGRYMSVRFGNVIGSRGSVLPLFTRLIRAGGPVTVTHPDVTRYFMTIPEACQLVLQAGGIGAAGEVLILDMGEQVRILDIARRMIAMSGKDVEIVFTGLRDGEKLHEELVGEHEQTVRPFHPKIMHTSAPALDPGDLDHRAWQLLVGAAAPAAVGAPAVAHPAEEVAL